MTYSERAFDPTARVHALAKLAGVGVLATSIRLAPTPVLDGNLATTGENVGNPELNTRSLYAIESDGED